MEEVKQEVEDEPEEDVSVNPGLRLGNWEQRDKETLTVP